MYLLECRTQHRPSLGGAFYCGCEVAQQTVVDAIDPAMHGQRLTARPGILHRGALAHILHLLDHVELAQSIVLAGFGCD